MTTSQNRCSGSESCAHLSANSVCFSIVCLHQSTNISLYCCAYVRVSRVTATPPHATPDALTVKSALHTRSYSSPEVMNDPSTKLYISFLLEKEETLSIYPRHDGKQPFRNLHCRTMQDELHAKPLFPSQRGEGRIVKLQQGTSALFTQPGSNPSNDNSSIVLTYQVGLDEERSNALVDLLVHCAKRDVFHVLRTQEQLGYLVFLSSWTNLSVHRYGQICLCIGMDKSVCA